MAELEGVGRLKFHTQAQTNYMTVLDTLVRPGDHVIVDFEISVRSLIALDFSQKGNKCKQIFVKFQSYIKIMRENQNKLNTITSYIRIRYNITIAMICQ